MYSGGPLEQRWMQKQTPSLQLYGGYFRIPLANSLTQESDHLIPQHMKRRLEIK